MEDKFVSKLNLSRVLGGVLLMGFVVSCGGGGGGTSSSQTPQPNSVAYFVDAPVYGLFYTTSSGVSGFSSSDGSFSFNNGDSVTFLLETSSNTIILGSINPYPNEIITPLVLYNDSISSVSSCLSNNLMSCSSADYKSLLSMQLIQTYGNCNYPSASICNLKNISNIPSLNINSVSNYTAYSSITQSIPNLISASEAFNNFTKISFSTYIYQGTDYMNEPIITIYINGNPVNLLADTGASGVIVNKSAVNIPSSDINTSNTWQITYGDGSYASGVMASATVCINPNVPQSCVVMPIGLITGGNAYSSSGFSQGDFGLDNSLNLQDNAYSYNYYLFNQNPYFNAFSISFYSLSNGYWETVSSTTQPIGQIVFGNASYFSPSNVFSYTGGFPEVAMSFNSFTDSGFFDTGSNYNFLSTSLLKAEIPNFSTTNDENNCSIPNLVDGGYTLSYSVGNSSYSFVTEPSSSSMCLYMVYNNLLIENIVLDNGQSAIGYEDFGLPEMLKHNYVWYLNSSGFVNQLGIK